MTIITRGEYLAAADQLREPYYLQFVSYPILAWLGERIGVDRIMNDIGADYERIPPSEWEAAMLEAFRHPQAFTGAKAESLLRAEPLALLCDPVCLAKTAARIIRKHRGDYTILLSLFPLTPSPDGPHYLPAERLH
jgi:hypothetical protein